MATQSSNRDAVRAQILALLRDRGPEKSICPSEAARLLSPNAWRELMADVRAVGIDLANEGVVSITQKGEPVDPSTAKGAIRYRLNQVDE
ncbi:MAG: DUF3253 domain-containing protein [Pseudomonadota bacterium]